MTFYSDSKYSATKKRYVEFLAQRSRFILTLGPLYGGKIYVSILFCISLDPIEWDNQGIIRYTLKKIYSFGS